LNFFAKLQVKLMKSSKAETVLIIGGNRGIGLGFVEYYLTKPQCQVIATYRDVEKMDALNALKQAHSDKLYLYQLDIRDEIAISHFAKNVPEQLDVLILNAGIIRETRGAHPQHNTLQDARELMETNVYGHDALMRVLYLKLLKPNSCVVYISSTVSHAGSNVVGRFHHYRASKAAGNTLMQNWNIELARLWLEEKKGDLSTRPCVFPISPGHVKTDMAGPNSNAPLTVAQSVQGMTAVIEAVRHHKDCSLYLYNGEVLERYPEPVWVCNAKKAPPKH
jgi:NAD(P)-dependent dehydrogenase (short-subunit alcohol dehydrogenase family)